MRERECPKCGRMMDYTEEDPDTGIVSGWDCECGYSEPWDPADEDFDDLEGGR